MAVVQFGSIVTSLKGKVGGQVFQGGRTGIVLRCINGNKGELIDAIAKGSLAEVQTVRKNFGKTTKGWSKLTDTQRASWASLLGVYTFTDKFGNVYNGTPYQIYTSMNLFAASLSLPTVGNAPYQVSALDAGVTVGTPVEGSTDFPQVFTVGEDFDLRHSNSDADGQIMAVFVSQMMNNSQSASLAKFKLVAAWALAAGPGKKLADVVKASWHQEPIVGAWFYVKVTTTMDSYIRPQFEQLFKVEIVEAT